VGQFRHKKVMARLGYAALMWPVFLIWGGPLSVYAANADECACVSTPAQISTKAAKPKPAPAVVKLPKRAGNFDLRLVGADASSESNAQALKAGEVSRKYVGIELGGKLGSVVQTQAQIRFTEAQSDPEKAMFDLSPVNQNADSRRALQDFSAASNFFGDRLTLSSYERNSSFALADTTSQSTKGQLQQNHVTAALWRSDRADFDIDAALSRATSNYWDFGDSPDADLHANNSQVSQYRSKLRFDRVGLSVFHRDTTALTGAILGEAGAKRAETEARVSLDVADWRERLGGIGGNGRLLPLPDSIWVGTNSGALVQDDPVAIAHQAVGKVSLGATRSFAFGTVNASYWRSETEPLSASAPGYRGAGHGVDLGSNLHFGAWGVSGNFSFANNQTLVVGNDTQSDSFNCAFFVTWKAPLSVDIKAGVTTNAWQNEFVDLDRLERNNSFRYQLALDLSRLASSSLAQKNVQLKLLASIDGNQSRSQSDMVNSTGDIFTGLQFAVPLHP
jgi:hypothetical protein